MGMIFNAIRTGDIETVKYYFEHGNEVNPSKPPCCNYIITALLSNNNNIAVLKYLIDIDVDLNVVTLNHTLSFALHRPECLELLLRRGADPNIKPILTIALRCLAPIESIELLLKYGADPTIECQGVTAIQYCADHGLYEELSLITRYAYEHMDCSLL